MHKEKWNFKHVGGHIYYKGKSIRLESGIGVRIPKQGRVGHRNRASGVKKIEVG